MAESGFSTHLGALPVLFRDNRFVVVNKPAGLKVHPGPGGGASVEDSFAALPRRRDGPWLAHRLDADTAGCLVIALRRAALHAAQAEFAAGRARKTYWAVVRGRVEAWSGCIDFSLAKRVRKSGWLMQPDPGGQAAITLWRVLGFSGENTWLELSPRTGRTHQIRVHCAAIGHPLLGDPIYGEGGSAALHLLARAIRLDIDPVLAAVAPPPAFMWAALAACGWLSEDEPDAKQQGLMPGLA